MSGARRRRSARTGAAVGALVVLVALGALVLSACGGDGEGAGSVVQVPPDAQWIEEALAPDEPEDAGPTDPTCPPASVAFSPASWLPRKPPRHLPSACEASLLRTIVEECEFAGGTCGPFSLEAVPCVSCLYSRTEDATFGFRVLTGDTNRLNFRGYTLRSGAPEACGDALEDYRSCLGAACACETSRRDLCFRRAKTGACASAGDGARAACQDHPAGNLVLSIVEADAFPSVDDALTMAGAFCGD